MAKIQYRNINGLRTIGCLGIIAMHIQANMQYKIDGVIYESIIPSWTQFVYLFLIISGFGMCCGYYDKFKEGKINLENFYSKRYSKILPFFGFLVLLDIIIEHTKESIFEGFIELTMLFGLLPNNSLSVIGVSWTLGVIFLFYICFPFFVYLLGEKRRAWISFICSIIISYLCNIYFFTDKFVSSGFTARHSFLYCLPFFMCGGLIYLYKDILSGWTKRHPYVQLFICIALSLCYYVVKYLSGILGLLTIFSAWLIFSLGNDNAVLSNKVMDYIGKISMEMYLSHMFIFRVVEKVGITERLGEGWGAYITLIVIVLVDLLIFINVFNSMYGFVKRLIKDKQVSV